MSFIAPNLSRIVGPSIAAKLMGKLMWTCFVGLNWFTKTNRVCICHGMLALSDIDEGTCALESNIYTCQPLLIGRHHIGS